MKQRLVVLLTVFCSVAAMAQKAPRRWDVYVGYGMTRVNSATVIPAFTANGGIVQFQWHLGSHLGLVGDFNGTHNGNIHNQQIDQTAYSFMGGPRYNFLIREGKQIIYGQGLFGTTYDTRSIAVPGTIPTARYGNTQWALSMFVGGGTELKVSPKIWFRPIEFGYYMTRFPTIFIPGLGSLNPNRTQNNLRYSAGVRFAF